jgi:hypothetical protein
MDNRYVRLIWVRLLLRCHYETTKPLSRDYLPSPIQTVASDCASWTSWLNNTYRLLREGPGTCLNFVATYFSTVHGWFPIIDESNFRDRLQNGLCESDTNDFLLLMSMYLVVQRPDEKHRPETMDDSLYHAMKHFYFNTFADIASSPSTTLLQSGVLLATYEYGHGMINAACHTLSTCVSASMVLGLHRLRAPNFDVKTEWNNQNENTLVWWAIVISDRYFFCLLG